MSATKEYSAPAVITPFDEFSRYPSLALEEAAAILDPEPWILDRLRHPAEVSTSYLQIVRDSGDAICIPLFRVRHSELFDTTIGSLSLGPDLHAPHW